MKTTFDTKSTVYSGLFVALAMVLPFFTGNIPQIGNMLCPMHIPIIFCGMMCGGKHGAVAGFISPLLRSMIFGAPMMFPSALAMAMELMVYGLVSGLLYGRLEKTVGNLYISLVSAMVAGRIVWGCTMYLLMMANGQAFAMSAFLSGAILTAIPGIILQLILIPSVMFALQRAEYGTGRKAVKENK